MKRKFKVGAMLFFTVLFLAGCQSGVNYKTVDVGNDFTLEVPDYMTEMDLESPLAVLEYGHTMKEHYVMVIEENIEELKTYGLDMNLEEYSDISVEQIKGAIDRPIEKEITDGIQEINGMDAIGYKIQGVFPENDLGIVYYIMYYMSAESFYYVASWTLSDYEREHTEAMDKIIYSLKAN